MNDYFSRWIGLWEAERKAEEDQYKQTLSQGSLQARRSAGFTLFPLRVLGTGYDKLEYPWMEVQCPAVGQIPFTFESGKPIRLFSISDHGEGDELKGTIAFSTYDTLRLSFTADELPDWTRHSRLAVDTLFDSKTFQVVSQALHEAAELSKGPTRKLRDVLSGEQPFAALENAKPVSLPELNEAQNHAVALALAAPDVAIIHGPPGTGKTTTLVQLINQLKEKGKVLVVAPSNTAVDVLARRLHAAGVNTLRLGHPARMDADIVPLTPDGKLSALPEHKSLKEYYKQAGEWKKMANSYKRNFGRAEQEQRKALLAEAKKLSSDARKQEEMLEKYIYDQAEAVLATPVGCTYNLLKNEVFHCCVVDEAGQATEPLLWIPILKSQKLVLAGDHKQLPPTLFSQKASKDGLAVSMMERLAEIAPHAALLNTQYRMHQDIMQYSNEVFYHNKLLSGGNVPTQSPDEHPSIEWVDTAGCGFDEKPGPEGHSLMNEQEAMVISKHYEVLKTHISAGSSIAVITPYRAQAVYIKQLIPALDANTVDSFQGSERDVVYISLVRSNTEGDMGFLKDYRRMNVAMTRAKQKLVIVGDSATLCKDKFFNDLFEYVGQLGGYRTAWEFS